MSASDKKKLRAAERAEKLTEKQLAEQKEAKKLKIFTTAFVVVLALMVVFAAYTGVTKTIEGRGIREKNTVALTIGDHELSNAELNYYFIDNVNVFYNQYGGYATYLGLDVTKPLNEQAYGSEEGTTWADDFLNTAVESAKAVYALNDAAAAAGFTLSENDEAAMEAAISNTEAYALYYYGYGSLNDYLKAMYGRGADEDSYREYFRMNYTAEAYQAHYADSLVYEDADLREAEADNYSAYSSFTYNYYYLNADKFADADAAEAAAKALTGEDITSAEALDAAIAALPENAEVANAASTLSSDVSYNSLNSVFADWVADADRKAGDIACFANNTETTDDDGNTATKTSGYYVILFNSRNDNNFPLVNVRHILAAFEGGTTDPNTGLTTYTDEEKAASKSAAEEIYNQWKNGEATEDSFAALANEKSDDGDGTTGGLYENIYPNQMVAPFEDWCFDETRKAGDTGIVETTYGYHIMYFSGESDVTYRNFMIENDLIDADVAEWYNALLDAVTATTVDTQYISMDLVLSAN